MTSRQINLALTTAAAAIAIGGLACASLLAVWPLREARQPAAVAGVSSTVQSASLPSLEALQAVANVPLRREAASATTTQTAPELARDESDAPPFTLVGTIGTSLALLRTSAGQVELKAVGEQSMGATVLAIRPAQVDVRFNGRSVTLHKPKEPPTPG